MTYRLPVKIDKGRGEPLVLLHGLGNTHESWGYVLKHIDFSRWRVIVPDLLGFGDAPKPDDSTYTPRDHADAVLSTLDALGVRRAVFVGHSMGCLVAIQIATDAPERVASMALFGAPLYRSLPRKHSWWQSILHPEGRYFSLFEVVKRNPDAVQKGGALAEELTPFVKGMEITPETWPAYKKSLEYTIMQSESYKEARQLVVPTVFVNGVFDFFIIPKNTHLVRRKNPGYVAVRRMLGPHELTPRQGKAVARVINASKDSSVS